MSALIQVPSVSFRSCLSVLSVDPSFKQSATSDDVALEVWGFKDGNFFCFDSNTEKRGFVDTIEAIKGTLGIYACTNVLVEDKANGSAIIEIMSQALGNVVPVNPLGGKEARARAASWLFKAGRVYFDQQAEWYERKSRNLVRFPRGKDDHDVDTTSQALLWLAAEYGYDEAFSGAMSAWEQEAADPRALYQRLYS